MKFRVLTAAALTILLAGGLFATQPSIAQTPEASPESTQQAAQASATLEAVTRTGGAITVSPVPENIEGRVYIAHQDFENGYMFWVSTEDQIWVLVNNPGQMGTGRWEIYPDTWAEGDAEPTYAGDVPTGRLVPTRGFGKVWSSVPGLAEELGLATTPEFSFISDYVYRFGGSVDGNGQYVQGPGVHQLIALSGNPFFFFEPDAGSTSGTWLKSDESVFRFGRYQ
jgi:hypothetical protein